MRGTSHSSVERVIIPDSSILLIICPRLKEYLTVSMSTLEDKENMEKSSDSSTTEALLY
jgi:adenylosuccinate lyase